MDPGIEKQGKNIILSFMTYEQLRSQKTCHKASEQVYNWVNVCKYMQLIKWYIINKTQDNLKV